MTQHKVYSQLNVHNISAVAQRDVNSVENDRLITLITARN